MKLFDLVQEGAPYKDLRRGKMRRQEKFLTRLIWPQNLGQFWLLITYRLVTDSTWKKAFEPR